MLFFLLKHAMKKADEAVQVVEATVEQEPSQISDKGAEDVYTEVQAALRARSLQPSGEGFGCVRPRE